MDNMTLDPARFLTAQDDQGVYATALAELRMGRKRSHWIWFVFPQLAGLGHSPTSKYYALSGREEARDYLDHPILGRRLVECAQALIALPVGDPVAILGAVDAQKLQSSMTLFARAAEQEEDRAVFLAVLHQYFNGVDDLETVRWLGA